MPTERPQQANLFWLVSALAVFLLVAWRPAAGVALLVSLTLGALSLALAHDYWAVALPNWGRGLRPKVSLDLFHLTNSRTAVRLDDVQYLALDSAGNQTTVNPGYNRGLNFQPPMSARLGLTLDFGGAP